MRNAKRAVLTAVLIFTVLLASGCTTYNNFKDTFFGEKGETRDTVKIGVLEPQTGNDSSKGELEIRGIELANKLEPEVLGKKVELVYADTQSSIYVAETAVQNLIDRDPAAVLGSYGDAVSLTAGQLLGKVKIPAVGITSTNPLITANNDYYFRVSFSQDSQGRAIADYVYEQMGQSAAAIVRTKDEDTANEMVSQFSKRLRHLSGEDDCITATVEIPQGTKDYSGYIKKLTASKAEAVFMPMSLSAGEKLFAAAAEELEGITFLVPKDWHTDELLRLQREYPGIKIAVASDVISNAEENDTNSLYKQLQAAYKESYGEEEVPEAVALAYDAYLITLKAIEEAETVDGEAVRAALLATDGFEGASGEISFNESGEPKKPINIDVIQDGKFVSVFTVK